MTFSYGWNYIQNCWFTYVPLQMVRNIMLVAKFSNSLHDHSSRLHPEKPFFVTKFVYHDMLREFYYSWCIFRENLLWRMIFGDLKDVMRNSNPANDKPLYSWQQYVQCNSYIYLWWYFCFSFILNLVVFEW